MLPRRLIGGCPRRQDEAIQRIFHIWMLDSGKNFFHPAGSSAPNKVAGKRKDIY